MTKSELYNKIIDIYKKSGQGLAGFVIDKLNSHNLIDQLIDEGLLKKVVHTYSHLPTDTWFCLTKGYCVEEDSLNYGKNSTFPYSCIRFYLGHEIVVEFGNTKMSLQDCIKDVTFIDKYYEWLKKNESKLKEMSGIQYMNVDEDNRLPKYMLEYVKTREWYEKNLTIAKCLSEMKERDDLNEEELDLHTQLLNLYKKDRLIYKDKIAEEEATLIELKKEINMRSFIRGFLLTRKQEGKIQDEVL